MAPCFESERALGPSSIPAGMLVRDSKGETNLVTCSNLPLVLVQPCPFGTG
ncbi:hypothetical protein Pan216_46780 [Planctomycetes bacterium Pan216]|uniref:Uncharacterized protein n=1 Tax=Kolteria novifilia TaxID=2527975 RepID=A0A518BA29_9BACT|nr:hypothetical protein Pan216_46780 [Planctomycetes bacterium Pan216]